MKAVLITGCSTGIGRALAERLAKRTDLAVYATARKPETLADLQGCRTLALDVCDEKSMRVAVEAIEAEHGAVYALVNNAGFSIEGAFEEAPMEDVRRQFETNVFGAIRLSQLVLPKMRERRSGRIVNVSSMGGRLSFPGGAYYHATKHSLEALSDVMRFELAGFGIRVAVIEPGPVRTAFGSTLLQQLPANPDGPYGKYNKELFDRVYGAYEGKMARFAAKPDAVARVIERAIVSRRPRTRYRVTAAARVLLVTRRMVPDRMWDAIMRRQFSPPRP